MTIQELKMDLQQKTSMIPVSVKGLTVSDKKRPICGKKIRLKLNLVSAARSNLEYCYPLPLGLDSSALQVTHSILPGSSNSSLFYFYLYFCVERDTVEIECLA